MSMKTNIPNYAGLFGNINFKKGDDARSVYSPAAYLSDLLQMLDDEFDPDSIDFDERRGDIKDIDLDAENTTTLIPYLDIVNEVLEKRVGRTSDGAYTALEESVYPFNMPFSLENEQIKNHLHHLGISAHELRRLFAKETDYHTVAREYLGLSTVELERLMETEADTVTEDAIAQLYGYTGGSVISELSAVATFMEATALQAHEMHELLYQKLYVEPTNHTVAEVGREHLVVEAGREYFYINTGISNRAGYVALSDDETSLKWYSVSDASNTSVPLAWFARTSRFVRLAKKIGLSFIELDHILRYCCKVNGVSTINADTLVYIAQVIYIHKTLEQPIDTVVAVLSEISFTGKTNEKLPQDQFNRIFNLPCVSVNEKYLHITSVMGEHPKQYADTIYHTYTPVQYHADLFSKDNDIYRQRLRHTLGFTDTDLINITNRLEFEKVADSSLWKNPNNQWQLLNVLYRIRALCEILNVHFLELFTLFDLLKQDPFIGQRDPHTYFVYRAPSTQNCFNIFMAGVNSYDSSMGDTASAIVYQHINYGGASRKLVPGQYDSSEFGAVNNDVISSLKVPSGWTVTLYEHPNLQGRSKKITTDTPWVGVDFNDITSSIVVTGTGFTINIGDRFWLLESLIALTKWMKEFGYSAEMLWKIVNGAPMTDRDTAEHKSQDLALYNTLLQSFKAGEIRPNTLKDVLGDERASHFAFSLIKDRCGDISENKSSPRRQDNILKDPKHLLLAYDSREIHELTEDFIRQLATITDYEFVSLELENKLQEKIFKNLVNHQVIDGSGKLLTENLSNRQLPPVSAFMLEYDFSEMEQSVFELFYRIYQENAANQLEADDAVEVQVFKSDLRELGLSEAESRELYDDLIYNGYIDEQGHANDVTLFSDVSGASRFTLRTGLAVLTRPLHQLLQQQLNKFEDSQVKISEQMFAELGLTPTALQDLIRNLQMNRYIDDQMVIQDKMRLVSESSRSMTLALQFYPHREAIFNILKNAIAADQSTWLQIDPVELGKIAAVTVSRWVFEDLQGDYLNDELLTSQADAFFQNEANRDRFSLRTYFGLTKAAIVFDHIAGIVNYANAYRLQDAKLIALEFNANEIRGLKQSLEAIGVLDDNELLRADQIPFFLIPENAAIFSVPAFSDYDIEIFFQLYDIAKAIDSTVKAVNQALKEYSDAQQTAVLEQLQAVLGIDLDAVKAVSAAVFKTDTNLHFAWLQPLLQDANALGHLDELPDDMHYTQAVKRIRQLALLINQQQLDFNEISLVLKDQDLVAKFPEDLTLPDGVTSVDAILSSEEFIYLFKDDDYWIYLAEDYTLIDKKIVGPGIDDNDLINRQKKNQEQQKRLKKDPIRQLFNHWKLSKIDAAFIDRYGTWVVVSGQFHYVRYADANGWDKRENHFGQVDNDFDSLEMIDAAYVDAEGRLFLFVNDQYVRYSKVNFILNPERQEGADQPTVDQGYPKFIAEDWNNENLPIQLPLSFARDLGPMFNGLDGYSYAFLENRYISSDDNRVRSVAEMWGHSEYDFGHPDRIDAALASRGHYLFFLNDKVVKYAGSIELANLQPEVGYPRSLHQEFPSLPDEFVSGIDAAMHGLDDRIYLFRNDDFVAINPETGTTTTAETRAVWGVVPNDIARIGQVDAAFVGLDGYTYLFSGDRYVRYSGSNYAQVDDGFPRKIDQDWQGLTRVTGAVVLADKTYLFGTNSENQNIYVRYSTLHQNEDDYLEVDALDPNARVIKTVLANRPDVDEIEVFPARVNDDFWSLPQSLTNGATDFQIDGIMNGPRGRVYLFFGNYYIEHDHASRWWSEPKILAEQFDRPLIGINERDRITAGFTGADGKTYLFYSSKYLRFSDPELHNLDNGYPRLTNKVWGKVRNNIDRTGKVDAALVVESRWEEQDNYGQLVDRTAMHTYLFSGNQLFRYEGNNYSTVESGYPRSMRRLSQEPRFRGLPIAFSDGLDGAFADQRQVYLFKGDSFHVVISDKENYKQYTNENFANIQAVTQERGVNYVLRGGSWQKLNHLDDRYLTSTPAIPRAAQKVEGKLEAAISAILRGTDGKTYIFGGNQYYDVDLGRSFAIAEVWGRSRNPIDNEETIDAAFVGRDGITYVFSGEWFVQYDSDSNTYVQQPVTHPPRRISDKWRGLRHVALAYVWEEDTYLFERPDANGTFRYLRYTRDNYDRPELGYPREGDYSLWNIPETYQQAGFDTIDAIFVHDDTLIFISDQRFISFNLNTRTWGNPQPLGLLYRGIPFNRTDFKDLKSGFVGADGTTYLFSQQCYVTHSSHTNTWTNVTAIKGDWGVQTNILRHGVDATWVSSDGVTYLFARDSYVRYSDRNYRYVDEGYPKAIATDLRTEPSFNFMPQEFQHHLDALETAYAQAEEPFAFFNGLLDNGRCLYFFTRSTLFTSSPNQYEVHSIDGLGHVDNNFTAGGFVDAAFVDPENEQTYLFSGEQYIRYSADRYRYIDEGYPKIIAESLAEDLGLDHLNEIYRDGIDAAFYLSNLGLVFFNERRYLNVTTTGDRTHSSSTEGDINQVWGNLDNIFDASDTKAIDGAYVDRDGALYVFKGQQFVRYSDTAALFNLNPYDEACYVDGEYPRNIREFWSQLDATILTAAGIDTVFQFEDEICFHTKGNFVTYNLDLSDHDERKPVQVLAYRWGEWSDYLLSDVHAISRFKALGQRFTAGELTLTELVSGAKGAVSEPYTHFAALFGFEKQEVRWVKQRNAFLPSAVNEVEADFQLELVLRLYDILATTRRLHVDVSVLYHKVWLPLYGSSSPNLKAAATGAYDVLVAIDCDNNYATLVKQIVNELNTLKRNALVPYVIANDREVNNPRQLYQKLLIDILMSSEAETSRIEEAIGAIQLYLHRYFINLEDIALDASDQQAARLILKDRWQWLRNYRVWEANRKVFLYPENYIRPELRDTKTAGFKALEENLSQGELTESMVEEAYLKYLDRFTEVSELTIAGGYVYDDNSMGTADKKLVLFGRTRIAPMRYFYRFGTFVRGESAAATWEPWEELDISIEATRVEPVFAFNRVFVFWTVLKESADNPSSAIVTTTTTNGSQTVSSSGNSQKEIKVYYSFYNLNKRWSQPQLLQTTFDNLANNNRTSLKFSQRISNVDLFVENSMKLRQNGTHTYENIYISVRFDLSPSPTATNPQYRAFNLTPELYSQVADTQAIENRGQALFNELFPHEFSSGTTIEEANVVKLNYSANSMDGPWFAYNHNGCGFLVKPDAIALPSNTQLKPLSEAAGPLSNRLSNRITAAVQVAERGSIYYFLDDQTYITVSDNGEITSEPLAINSRFASYHLRDMQVSGNVDSAFVLNGSSYLTLDAQNYKYDGATLKRNPFSLSERIPNLPTSWMAIDAAFATTINGSEVNFWFNNASGTVLHSNTGRITSIRTRFGLPNNASGLVTQLSTAAVINGALHLINNATAAYVVYNANGTFVQHNNDKLSTVLKGVFGNQIDVDNVPEKDQSVAAIILMPDGKLLIRNTNNNQYYFNQAGERQVSLPQPFSESRGNESWMSGLFYTSSDRTSTYCIGFYRNNNSNDSQRNNLARAWDNNRAIDFDDTNTGVNVTGAFTTVGGRYIIIITDSDTFHLFDNSQTPGEILAQLQAGTNQGDVNDLSLDVYLSTTFSNAIWRDNRVDAAFIGTEGIGDKNALYLFRGDQYLRFTINEGKFASRADDGYPKTLSTNTEGLPKWTQIDAAFTSPDADADGRYVSYFFNNPNKQYYRSDTRLIDSTVDAAYVSGNYLYLIVNTRVGDRWQAEYYRYTLEVSANNKTIPRCIDSGYPKTYNTDRGPIGAALELDNCVYLFSGTEYYRLGTNVHESTALGTPLSIAGSWGNIPSAIRTSGLDTAFQHVNHGETTLYLIQDNAYISYDMSDRATAKPYEIDRVKYEVVRLTSSTAEQLNQILFAGGIQNLLQMSTQEMNESPTISFDDSTPHNIQMNEHKFGVEPTNSHLDFNSANGIYYWEVFFHAPFLIAQTLNANQQFELAKQWYEYIFDPTEISDYWKFLPFLGTDPAALMATLSNDLDTFESLTTNAAVATACTALAGLTAALAPYQEVFLGKTNITLYETYDLKLKTVASIDALETRGNGLLLVAKIGDSYHVRIFDKFEQRVVDRSVDSLNRETLTRELGKAFSGQTLTATKKATLIHDITSAIEFSYKLADITRWSTFIALESAIKNLDTGAATISSNNPLLVRWQREMQEVLEIVKQLDYRIDLMGNYNAQIAVYLEDPFDPHAIAALRPLAYRKAIVMRYIDNLLDWGDMLFRQYTRESIHEARMLYILAYDLLGEKPKNMGRVVLESTKAYNDFNQYTGQSDQEANPNYDFLIDLENAIPDNMVEYEQSLSFAATQFDTITNPYFFIKENELFTEYWTRVEDRLAKIRDCLNIEGVAQPLPLFQPPIDPMALVNAAASGGGIAAAALATGAASVPDYRFDTLIAKARDLVGRLKNLSDNLLAALEKKDSEELSQLQHQQEEMMLTLVTVLKDQQIKEAENSLRDMETSKLRAQDQMNHYTKLIADGYLPEERTQIAMMGVAASVYGIAVLGKVVSGLARVVPQFTAGPFSFGVTSGGEDAGEMLDEFAEAKESVAEGLSMAGEAAGVVGQFKRSTQDWALQKKMATWEITQLEHQISAQNCRIAMAKQELLMHKKEIENSKAIAQFMKSKFSNAELYSWMSGKISGLFFQTFKLAHDYAKQAEQAFIFEKGLQVGKVNYITGMYWDSQCQGLLAGYTLELDLDRMEKAYAEIDSRRLEITKNISLLELDPLALLALKTQGACTFRLSEELFDYDFPGHYNRQIKSVSLAFDIGEGQSVNATLTQLSSKLVMDTDVKAVKYLIDPTSEATTNVRVNWRAHQQIALSHVDQYTENSGMFELNFGDERYLPFEGTGAVSNWRLELNGKRGSYNPADLLDATIKLRYTAKQGGSRFANEVKGLLKPYNATSFFDLAYNFPDEWAAVTTGDSDEVNLTFTRDMLPNMSSSKIIGLLIRYQYNGTNNGPIFTINDMSVPNNTYLQPSTLTIGQKGSEWTFALKGDGSELKNAEMVLVYKANV